jgi:peptidyl-prolyl cis-trans isomerase B (cyclophilin B)
VDTLKAALGLITLVLFLFPAATFSQEGRVEMENLKNVRAVIETVYGEIEIKFFPDKAPNHVKNFIKLAKEGTYDGTIFHRVIPGFMIQGGDPNTKGPDKSTYGMGGPGYTIDAEFNDISHTRGIVSMARASDPDSAGSQFFIVVKGSTFLDGKYTVFGEVTRGMEIADKIVNLPRDARDLPRERVEMKVKIIE